MDARGIAVVEHVAEALRKARPGVTVQEAYLGGDPGVYAATESLVGFGFRVVVIPLLLSGGHAVEQEIFRSAQTFDRATFTPPLGPHETLTSLLWRRIQQTGAAASDPVVVANGLTRPGMAQDLQAVADQLSRHWAGPVSVGLADDDGGVAAAVERARAAGRRVILAGYLLGYGYGRGVLAGAGADAVTEPFGSAPLVVARVVDLFDRELARQREALRGAVA